MANTDAGVNYTRDSYYDVRYRADAKLVQNLTIVHRWGQVRSVRLIRLQTDKVKG